MEHFDVVIIGAGISGIGAAVHLQEQCPGRSYAILESREAIGGTWDLFRYPGIRSDSDMHTLGFDFKPWKAEKAIADGPSILDYLNETADERDVRRHIRHGSRLETASWSSDDARWVLEIARSQGGAAPAQPERISCNFLVSCSGYYSYDEPYLPQFEGVEDFEGRFFHAQLWPEDLDYAGKRVVVIGSGATAMTVVPAMANDVEHITMLQRSPTYVISRPDKDTIANFLRKILPERMAYAITRFKNVQLQKRVYAQTRTNPGKVKKFLLDQLAKHLDAETIEQHFTPSYDPWDQRLCLIPNADLFEAIKSGKAGVVTDRIERITKKGILLASGTELEADIIIAATGLNMKLMGGVAFSVDGEAVNFADTFTYKGMMFSGVPNLVQTFGYINASWTLRADLTSEYVCRLLNHMQELGARQCTPRLLPEDEGMPRRDWIQDFSAGYMQRAMPSLPKQGDHAPWLNTQDFTADKKMVRHAPLEDGRLVFDNPA